MFVQWASICFCQSLTTQAAAAAHPVEFEVSRCRMFQFARCFIPAKTRVWNDLSYTVFDTGTLDGFKGAVNRWLLPWVCYSVFRGACAVGLRKQFINNLVFPNWACAFNNNWRGYRRLGLFRSTSVQPLTRLINHQGIILKLCSVGGGVSVQSILIQFLSGRSQYIVVDGCWSMLVNVVSEVLRSGVLGPCSCSSCTLRSFSPYWITTFKVMLTTPLWLLLCHLPVRE